CARGDGPRLLRLDQWRTRKKLTDAARHWAEARARRADDDADSAPDEALDDLADLGMDKAAAAALLDEVDGQEGRGEDFALWLENGPVLVAFVQSTRCWRLGAFGGVMGFDYVQLRERITAREGRRKYIELLPVLEPMMDAVLP